MAQSISPLTVRSIDGFEAQLCDPKSELCLAFHSLLVKPVSDGFGTMSQQDFTIFINIIFDFTIAVGGRAVKDLWKLVLQTPSFFLLMENRKVKKLLNDLFIFLKDSLVFLAVSPRPLAKKTTSAGVAQKMSKMDGGLCWLVVLGSFLSQFTAFGFHNVFGQLYIELLQEFGESKALTGTSINSEFFIHKCYVPRTGKN